MNEFKIIKKELTLIEYLSFINNVVSLCFSDIDGKITYNPQYKMIYIKKYFLEMYTDYTPVAIEGTSSLIANHPNYINFSINEYIEQINSIQFENILDSIDETIEFKKQQLLIKYQNDLSVMPDITNAKLNEQAIERIMKAKMNKMPQDHKKKRNI